jgi:hypothetical protein
MSCEVFLLHCSLMVATNGHFDQITSHIYQIPLKSNLQIIVPVVILNRLFAGLQNLSWPRDSFNLISLLIRRLYVFSVGNNRLIQSFTWRCFNHLIFGNNLNFGRGPGRVRAFNTFVCILPRVSSLLGQILVIIYQCLTYFPRFLSQIILLIRIHDIEVWGKLFLPEWYPRERLIS